MIRSDRFVVTSNIRFEASKRAVFNIELTQAVSFFNSAYFVWDLKNQQSALLKNFPHSNLLVQRTECVARVAD